MSIASAPFLLLFLPAVVGIYYVIPAKKDLRYRNAFLFLAGLIFYTWGEPVFVLLWAAMTVLTWGCGKMAYGQKGTRCGKTAIWITVVVNLAVMLIFGNLAFVLRSLGQMVGKDLSGFSTGLPIGFSFFVFSSVSYVVDIYRGQCESGNLLHTALYTGAFFRILQGPIIAYRKFECQTAVRPQSLVQIGEGMWRVSVGLCKKVIIADSLSFAVQRMLGQDFSAMPLGDAWLGCIAYLVYLYFDFSGYSDMAIGLAKLFGYAIPENFNYPYISTSVAEFWRRWHITLCTWFTEYLYYPLLLGPSIRFRKMLQRYDVQTKTAQTLQNIFVMGVVWLVTSLWHGMNLNYFLWGLLNCSAMLIEPHVKTLNNKRLNTVLRRIGFLLFLCISMPLMGTQTIQEALSFYQAMVAGAMAFSDNGLYCFRIYGIYLIAGIIGCFPVIPYIKKRIVQRNELLYRGVWDVCAGILLFFFVLVAISFLFTRDTITFLYQQ